MAIIEITPDIDRTKSYFGSVHNTRCLDAVLNVPIQLMGAIPVRFSTDKIVACEEFKFIDGDENSFLFKWPGAAFTDQYKLEEFVSGSWSEVVTGNPSNVLGVESGTKYAIGFDNNYPTYGGFKIDWGLVYGYNGAGKYRFVVDNASTPLKQYSSSINLFENTDANKDNTVYLSWESIGGFQNFQYTLTNNKPQLFDLVDLNNAWFDGCRYSARFDLDGVETEQTIVTYANYSKGNWYTEDNETYLLRLFKTTNETARRLYNYGLKSDSVKLTDNNADQNYIYEEMNIINNEPFTFESYVNDPFIYNVEYKLKSQFDLGKKPC